MTRSPTLDRDALRALAEKCEANIVYEAKEAIEAQSWDGERDHIANAANYATIAVALRSLAGDVS